MAAVPIQIDGVFYPYSKDGRSQPVAGSMIGQAFVVGLGVGGGPIIPVQPPDVPPGGGGGPPGTPTFPIWGPPGMPVPPKPGYPPVASHPLPPVEGPVDPGYSPPWAQIPEGPPDGGAPPPDGGIKPPPPEGGWGYHPEYGWGYFPGSGGKPQPPG